MIFALVAGLPAVARVGAVKPDLPAGPGGVIQAYTSDMAHLLLDISSYFAP